jgi:SAM-dependent methyltransferase
MTAAAVRVSREWLALRELADAAARAQDLVDRLRRDLERTDRWMIHDLGCGTGAMTRWLAPLLPGPQHWVLHDRDADLLEIAASERPARPADRAAVTVEVRQSDITRLDPGDLAGAALITASAVLDMLTAEELTRLVAACAGARCPILLTLSVIGRVDLTPADPLDSRLSAAFDAHQRRSTKRGRLLGPDAVALAVQRFGRLGAEAMVSPSPWELGDEQSDLLAEWLTGWVGAACEQSPELAREADDYTRRRLAQAAAGELRVTVGHADLLVSSRPRRASDHPPRRADRRRRQFRPRRTP